MTVRTKLIALNVALLSVLTGGIGWAVHARLKANLYGEVERQLEGEASSIKTTHLNSDAQPLRASSADGTFIGRNLTKGGLPPDPNKVVEVLRSTRSEFRIETSPSLPTLIPIAAPDVGQQLPDTLMPLLREKGIKPVDSEGFHTAIERGKTFHTFFQKGEPTISLSIPLYEGGRLIAVAQSTRSLAPIQRQMADLDRVLFMLLPGGLLGSVLLGAALVGTMMRPLRKMIDSAKRLEPDLSATRLPVVGSDEFAMLATEFNGAFDRTAEAFERQRQAIAQLERFTADAGHELRTPLGAIKSGISYLAQMAGMPADSVKPVQIMNRSADRMAKLIDDLLLLSRQDGGQSLSMHDRVNIAKLLDEAREELAEPGGVEVNLCAKGDLTVRADPDALKRVFLNLMSNAFAYARTEVTIVGEQKGSETVVSFRDDGEGIAPEHLERLGERFYRPDTARSRQKGGTGLGLAIARSLCEAHGGRLEIRSKVGLGTEACAILPVA